MTVSEFIQANQDKITRLTRVMSHPQKGYAVIHQKSVKLWQSWGWTLENSEPVVDPAGVKPSKRKSRKKSGTE